jgi:selenide,water dikinase
VISPTPIVKDLVLVGGGHTHVAVLKRFGMKPLPGVRVTLVSRDVDTPYSGMLPGIVAGHYSHDEAHIDLEILCRFAGARVVFDEAIGLDPAARSVQFRSRPPISYDVLSINIGSTPGVQVPGSLALAVPVKPIDRFLSQWDAMRERLRTSAARTRVAVVGGGAGGVELILAVEYRLRTLLAQEGRSATHLEYHLFTATDDILTTHNRPTRSMFQRILVTRGIVVHAGCAVTHVSPNQLQTRDGRLHEADEILWTTEASAAPWLAESGLAVDDRGFVRVASTLQSTSHPEVFAAGDVASMIESPRPKSGVFAVRQGAPLARNLRSAVLGERLRPYHPQRQFLSLISTGDRYAVASRGPFALGGRWVWRWKDRIDRAFMRTYQELPDMQVPAAPGLPAGLRDADATAMVSSPSFRCGGCGAKVGASVLARALQQVAVTDRDDVLIGLDDPDDAAVIAAADGTSLVHTIDFFRAIIDDPYVFGQIAANHALGDVYAMGAEPRSALALVTIPYGPEAKVEDTLTHLLAGTSVVLREAGVALVGGHTSEGAELGMGLAVNGAVDRHRLLRKAGLRPGDRLVLTKAIGTGTLFAADMRHRARGRWIVAAVRSMIQSNRAAADCLLSHGASACTDVTGFGLIGHLVEMLRASDVEAEIDLAMVPLLDGAEQTVRAGILSSLQPENIRLRRAIASVPDASDDPRFGLLFDPQTAGGLLAGIPADQAEPCVRELRARGYAAAVVIGRVVARTARPELITLRV